MILWLVLFVLVIAISFILAIRSMRDYQEIPPQEKYGLFLVRKPQALAIILNALNPGLFISLERLFKGSQSTLVMFAPVNLGIRYKTELDLLELEDYTNVPVSQISAWEVGIKEKGKLFEGMPPFSETEQFWWQVTFSSLFQPQIRAVLIAQHRRDTLANVLQKLAPGRLVKLPKAYSNETMLEFYQKRSFKKDSKNSTLRPEEILQLVAI